MLCICSLGAVAQTKLIAFKSHSGNTKNFKEALLGADADLMNHNLGMAPRPTIRIAQVDSLILLNDTTSVLVTSTVCKRRYNPEEHGRLWEAGSDTVYNDPLWTSNNPDSIKQVLKKDFYFHNVDSIKFVGYDKPSTTIDNDQNDQDNNQQLTPAAPQRNSTPGLGLPIALISVLFGTGIAWLLSWRRQHFAKAKSV